VSGQDIAWKRLRHVTSIKGGAGFPHEEQGLQSEALPFFKVASLEGASAEGALQFADHSVSRETAKRLGAYVFAPGTVVFAKVGAALLLNRFRQLGSAACIDNNMMGLEPFDGVITPRYLMYSMACKDLSLIANPGAVPSVNGSQIAEERIWCPAPAEQERIANFLDDKTARIDALIAEKERLVRSLKEFQYSQISDLMTKGLDKAAKMVLSSQPEVGYVPAHWVVTPLKFMGNVRSGVAKGKDTNNAELVTLPYLRVANVQNGYVDLSDVSTIDVTASDAERFLLRKGDVLMNEGGDNDKLGRGAVWQGQVDPCIHQNHVFSVRLIDTELSEWVSCFTSTDAARTYFFLRSKQSTNLASINQSNVRELPVPMPPPSERKAIMAEIQRSTKATDGLIGHAIEHIARLREYRSSLISAAVTGQLDVGVLKAVA
jgi:type I restriction enzyme S subunit